MSAPRPPSGHGRLWPVACELGTFGYADLARASGLSYGSVQRVLRAWEAAGAVARAGLDGPRLLFRVVRPEAFDAPPAPEAPARPGESPERNKWQAIRQMRTFTPTDIAACAATARTAVSPEEARRYAQALLRVGYLKAVRTAIPGRREAVYRLIRNTGPEAPRLRRVAGVFDPNTGRFLTGQEATP